MSFFSIFKKILRSNSYQNVFLFQQPATNHAVSNAQVAPGTPGPMPPAPNASYPPGAPQQYDYRQQEQVST